MALKSIPGFISGSYNCRSRAQSAQRTINLHVETNGSSPSNPYTGTVSPRMLVPRSGKRLFTTLPTSPIHGSYANKTRAFYASGGVVYEVFADGTFNVIGNIDIGTNPATFKANGTQLLICSAGKVYVADGLTIFRPIVNFASGTVNVNGTAVTWVDGDLFQDPTDPTGDIVPGNLLMLGTTVYNVTAVANNQNLTIDADAGMVLGLRYQAGTEYLSGVMPEIIDQYGIVSIPNTKIFRISNNADVSKWDELDTGEKSGSVDNIAAIKDLSGQLALIGDDDSAEIWGDSGNSDFPFERISGRSLNVGTAAPWSVAKLPDGTLVWLVSTEVGEHSIVASAGGEPVPISDRALENTIRQYSRVYDAIGSTYLENGHLFYRIDFPTADRTWEYDATEKVWVELGKETAENEVYAADHGRYQVHVTWPEGNRMDLAGDYASGKIWQISPDFVDDDGVDFEVMRIGPNTTNGWKFATVAEFTMPCELGTVDPTALGADGKPLVATVSFSYSRDGANTWIPAEAAGALGRAGEYEGVQLTPAESTDAGANSQTNPQAFISRPTWTGLGAFQIAWTPKVKSTGRMLRAIFDGLIDVQ